MSRYFKFYRDGFTFLWWGVQVRWGWTRGVTIGVSHEPHRGYADNNWTHSTLTVWLGIVWVSFQHGSTRIRLPEREPKPVALEPTVSEMDRQLDAFLHTSRWRR